MFRLRYIPYVIRQATRSRTRSALTAAGVAAAMFLFSAVQAMQAGAERATQTSAGDTKLIVYRKDRYCPFTSRMPQSYAPRIAAIEGVASVVPMRIAVSNCRTSLDVVTFRGVPADAFVSDIARELEITSGSLEEWQRRSDATLLGETLARRRGLSVGDRFDAAGVTVYVAGCFRSSKPQHQSVGYVHLDFLQYASGSRSGGYVTQFDVRVADPQQLERVAKAIDAEFAADPEPTHTRSEQAFVEQAAADVLEIVSFTRWLGWGCLLAVLALIGNAIVLAVQDRVRQNAVLQTLGFTERLVAQLIVAEGLFLSLVGGAVGTLAAWSILWWGGWTLSVEGLSVPILTDTGVILRGLMISTVLGVAAGLFPAWQASRQSIVACLRSV